MIARHAADDGRIVAKRSVPVDLAPVGEKAVNIILRERTLRVARQLGLVPGVHVRANLLAQKSDLVLQMRELKACFLVSTGFSFKLRDLSGNRFQLPLRFDDWVQKQLLATHKVRRGSATPLRHQPRYREE